MSWICVVCHPSQHILSVLQKITFPNIQRDSYALTPSLPRFPLPPLSTLTLTWSITPHDFSLCLYIYIFLLQKVQILCAFSWKAFCPHAQGKLHPIFHALFCRVTSLFFVLLWPTKKKEEKKLYLRKGQTWKWILYCKLPPDQKQWWFCTRVYFDSVWPCRQHAVFINSLIRWSDVIISSSNSLYVKCLVPCTFKCLCFFSLPDHLFCITEMPMGCKIKLHKSHLCTSPPIIC